MVDETSTTHRETKQATINIKDQNIKGFKMAFTTVVYKAGTVEDTKVQYNYITQTGVFEVKVDKIYGTEHKNEMTGTLTQFITFELVVNNEDKIVAKEMYTYTAKENDKATGVKKGDLVNTKGYNLVSALIGMQSGKNSAVAKWTPCVVKEFGKDINAMELKALSGKTFKVKNQVLRSIYINRDGIEVAKEDNSIARVFASTGHSLAEYEEALEAVETRSISIAEALGTVEAKAIETEAKRSKPRYQKCTADEWNDIKAMSTASATAPSGKEEEDEEEEEMINIPTTNSTSKDNSNTLDDIDLDDIEL